LEIDKLDKQDKLLQANAGELKEKMDRKTGSRTQGFITNKR
jgi:hypothetical protein